jgi:hypothetical protein
MVMPAVVNVNSMRAPVGGLQSATELLRAAAHLLEKLLKYWWLISGEPVNPEVKLLPTCCNKNAQQITLTKQMDVVV